MKVSKIQPIISSKIETGNVQVVAQDLSEKIATTAKKTLTSRKIPSSIGLDSDYYVSKKISKKKIKYSQVDEAKMKNMSNTERKCYEAYLILTGNYTTL